MFSERELEIIKIIGKKKMSYVEIAFKVYGMEGPFNEQIIIGNSVRTIIKKCEHYKLDFTFQKVRKEKKLFIRRVKQ